MLLAIGLLGVFYLLSLAFQLSGRQKIPSLMSATWLVFTFAQAGLRGGGFNYYVLMTLPPLTLASAFAISNIYEIRKKRMPRRSIPIFEAGILMSLIIANYSWTNLNFFKQYIPYKLGEITYDEFLFKVDDKGMYTLSNAILGYIQDHTTSDDFIYLWSDNVQYYYYADRRPPIDILWPSYVSATGPPQRIFNPRTKYILVADHKDRPQWLIAGLDHYYFLETHIDVYQLYRRITY